MMQNYLNHEIKAQLTFSWYKDSIPVCYLETELNKTGEYFLCSIIREIKAMAKYASMHIVDLPQI